MAQMRMVRRTAALLIAVGFCTVVSAPTYAAVSGLDGTIVDSRTGLPIAGVAVQALPRTGGNYGNAVTDASGHYTMPNLVPGQYTVAARKVGYLEQFAFGKEDAFTADPVTVPGVADLSLVAETFGAVRVSCAGIPVPPGSPGHAWKC